MIRIGVSKVTFYWQRIWGWYLGAYMRILGIIMYVLRCCLYQLYEWQLIWRRLSWVWLSQWCQHSRRMSPEILVLVWVPWRKGEYHSSPWPFVYLLTSYFDGIHGYGEYYGRVRFGLVEEFEGFVNTEGGTSATVLLMWYQFRCTPNNTFLFQSVAIV